VLKEVIPDMESTMDDFGPSALRALSGGVDDSRDASHLRHAALIRYGELLVESQGTAMPDALRARIDDIASAGAARLGSVTVNREVFGEVTRCVSSELSCQFDPDDLARMRSEALAQHGLMVDGSLSVRPENSNGRLGGSVDESFIDAEIVAIYW
jgi:hypothetical protein